MQKLSKTLAIMGLMTPLGAGALGTGEIKLYSALNQKLNAELPLVASPDEALEDLRVNLAPAEAFAKAGIDRPYYLTGLRFEVLTKGRQVPAIRITSAEAIHEPFVNFLVEMQWPQGHVLREFTLLLDPPATFKERAVTERRAPQAQSLASADTPRPASAEAMHANPASYNGSEYGPVRAGETLWSIARVVSRDRNMSVEQMAEALRQANPQAFVNGNINAMVEGSMLRVPGAEGQPRRGAPDVKKASAGENGAKRATASVQAAAAPSASPTPAAGKPLILLAPDQSGKKGGGASKAELAMEIADTAKQENDHLRARLDDLEQQVRLAQRLLTLKDEQIAALQAGKPMPAIPPGLAAELAAQAPEAQAPAAVQNTAPTAAEKPAEAVTEPAKPVEAAAPAAANAGTPQTAADTAKPAETDAVKLTPPAVVPAAEPAVPAAPAAPVAAVEAAAAPAPAPSTAEPAAAQPQPTPAPAQAAAPKPAPAPAVQATPASEATSGFGDTFMFGLLGAVGAAIGGLALLAVKRRRAALAELDQDLPLQEIRPINLNPTAESQPQESSGAIGLVTPSQHGSFLSDFTPSDFDVLDSDNEAIDPISEADVYLAYGRYNQAEELIRQAIAENPFRDECKLKLLEVFFTAQNREGFEKYVAELLDENKNSDQDFWARVVDMGRSLAPENPIFSRGKAEQPAAAAVAAQAPAAPAPAAVADDLQDEEFSFDLGDDAFGSVSAVASEEAPQAAVAAAEETADLPSMAVDEAGPAFDLDAFAQAEPERPAAEQEEPTGLAVSAVAEPVVEPQASGTELDDPGLSFDLGDFQVEPEAPVVDAAPVVEDQERTLDFDASALGGGGFSFAGVAQTDEAEAPAATQEDASRTLEFSLGDAAAATESVSVAEPATASEEPFDMDFSAITELASSASAVAPTEDEEFEEFSVDLGFDGSFADLAPNASAASPAKDDKGDKDEEFNFDMTFDMNLAEQSLGDLGQDTEVPQAEIDLDELETKLDLAKAYVDMENVDAAKLLLEEILQQGDERQKQEAQDLLTTLV